MPTELNYSTDTILRDTLPQLPGAQRDIAYRELQLTIWEFFEQSYAWSMVMDDTYLVAGDLPYQISVDGYVGSENGNAKVLTVLDAAIGTPDSGFEPLTPMNRPPLDLDSSDTPPTHWYIASNADTIKFHPYYTGSDTTLRIRTTLALCPLLTGAYPRQFESKWYDAIRTGFLARMYRHPKKPYSQPVLADRHEREFQQLIGYYAAQRKKGYNNSQQWSHPIGWSK